MTEDDLNRARQAYGEWREAGKALRETGDARKLHVFVERHGDFLKEITRPAREKNPDLNRVSFFEIIKQMKENTLAAHDET